MKRFIKKHKVLTMVICVLLLIGALLLGFIYSKLSKLSYHDGSLSATYEQTEEDVVVVKGEDITPESSEEEDVKLILDEEEDALDAADIILAEGDPIFDKDVLNILLLGTDERTEEFSTKARADSIMILSFNKKDNSVKLVSLQRGMGFQVPDGIYKGQYDWLTHLFRYGGAEMMMQAISNSLKIDVKYYVRVNFNTFTQLIDSVGGVDIELSALEAAGLNGEVRTNVLSKNKMHEGLNHLDGHDALQYSRLRYVDSDWNRVKRQRNVIQTVVKSTENMSIKEINDMLDEVLPLIQTNMKPSEILSMVRYVPAVLGEDFEQMTIPQKGTYGSMEGMGGRTLYAVDFDKNSKLLHEFLYGIEE